MRVHTHACFRARMRDSYKITRMRVDKHACFRARMRDRQIIDYIPVAVFYTYACWGIYIYAQYFTSM